MYQVTYYMGKNPYHYNYLFKSLWAATFKARAIFEEHGFSTDVMNITTGEVLAIFQPGNNWVNEDLETDIHSIALQALE